MNTQLPKFFASSTSRVNAGDGAYTYIYAEETEDNFAEYCAALEETGFAQYTKNAFNGNGENGEVKNLFALRNFG